MLKHLASATLVSSSLAALALFLGPVAEGLDGTAPTTSAQRVAPASDTQPGCGDSIPIAPVVMMTTAGWTLSGSQLSTITVYSNGLVTTSTANGFTGGSSAQQTMVDRAAVDRLAADLRALGAFTGCDQTVQVADIPLTTMTVFRSGPKARSHSYSYWLAEGDAELVEDAVLDFLAAQVLPE